jgi:hypothetical protein
MKYLILISFIFSSLTAYADDVKYVKQGDIVPYTGYLFSPDKEREVRLMDQDYKFTKDLNLTLTNMNKLYEENTKILEARITNKDNQIDNLNNELSKKSDGLLGKVGMFILGALVTTGIAYGVSRATK